MRSILLKEVMSEKKAIVVDCNREETLLQILPCAPLLSSKKVQWNGIHFEYYRHPPHEMPEYISLQHKIVIHTKFPPLSKVERTLDGRFRSERLVKGNIVVTPANTYHSSFWDKEAEFITLRLEPNLVSHTVYEAVAPERVELLPHFSNPEPLVYQIGLALKAELESDGLGDNFYVESLANALYAHLLKKYSTHQPEIHEFADGLSQYKLRQAIDYINEHLDETIKLADIAEVLDMSQYYFCQLFKQSMGVTPHQYLIQCRLAKAKQLLANPEKTIAVIALECGFASQSHLTRLFRKHLATTPKAYRDAL